MENIEFVENKILMPVEKNVKYLDRVTKKPYAAMKIFTIDGKTTYRLVNVDGNSNVGYVTIDTRKFHHNLQIEVVNWDSEKLPVMNLFCAKIKTESGIFKLSGITEKNKSDIIIYSDGKLSSAVYEILSFDKKITAENGTIFEIFAEKGENKTITVNNATFKTNKIMEIIATENSAELNVE